MTHMIELHPGVIENEDWLRIKFLFLTIT